MEEFRRESLTKGDKALVGDNGKILLIRVISVIRGLSSLFNREMREKTRK
jgi:hypothetical protein